eukprot:CCRYP_021017-RA/>CCRYP_021017-RA protein AED:0.16 eAED:0.45 QI:282/0.5/0.66/1/0/0/3/0/65
MIYYDSVRKADGETLQFSTGEVLHTIVHERIHRERLHDIANELRMDVCVTNTFVEELTDCALELG